MISKTFINIDELAQMFILSNTPYYLYKNYSNDPSINKLAEEYSTTDLITTFNEELTKDKNTYEEVVLFYAIIIALTKKPYREVKEYFKGLRDCTFRWAKQISDIYIFLNVYLSQS